MNLLASSHLQELYRRIHTLTGNAGIAGVLPIAQMADALEALLKEIYEKPKNINASTLRTVAAAIDFLGLLFERTTMTDAPVRKPSSRPISSSWTTKPFHAAPLLTRWKKPSSIPSAWRIPKSRSACSAKMSMTSFFWTWTCPA